MRPGECRRNPSICGPYRRLQSGDRIRHTEPMNPAQSIGCGCSLQKTNANRYEDAAELGRLDELLVDTKQGLFNTLREWSHLINDQHRLEHGGLLDHQVMLSEESHISPVIPESGGSSKYSFIKASMISGAVKSLTQRLSLSSVRFRPMWRERVEDRNTCQETNCNSMEESSQNTLHGPFSCVI